jgi:pimeloyl-ACP methyl ester carboxylesterase
MNFKSVKRILIPIVSVMALTSCNMQNHMLYYPSPYLPSAAELAAENIAFWPSGPASYRGFIGTTEIGNIKGTVAVFHGNAGTAADRAYYVKALGSIGYRVILAEYPGYGQREGQLGEKPFVNDAQATVRLISETYGGPLFLLGESLGCAVVAGAAKDPSLRIDGILLITPWDTLLAVAKSLYPWFPVRLLMKDKYDSVDNLKSFQERIAVVGAERDEILPIRHAVALYQSLTGSKKMWTIKGAGHNDWLMHVDVSKWREFMDFVRGGGESS